MAFACFPCLVCSFPLGTLASSHPSIHFLITAYHGLGIAGVPEPNPAILERRQDTLRTSRQFIAGPASSHSLTICKFGGLVSPNYLWACIWAWRLVCLYMSTLWRSEDLAGLGSSIPTTQCAGQAVTGNECMDEVSWCQHIWKSYTFVRVWIDPVVSGDRAHY